MNVFTPVKPPYWLQPNEKTRRNRLTRPRRNPSRPPQTARLQSPRRPMKTIGAPINMGNYLQQHGGAPLDHPRRCTAKRQDGQPCRRYAIRGGFVCRVHGGGSPQVVAKARERLLLASDRMSRELLGIATGAESEAVRLTAIRDALDRAGLSAKQNVEVGVELKPYEQVLSDIAGVAQITRAESRARRGLAPDEREPLEVVEAELVPEPPESRPCVAARERTPGDRPDAATDDSAPRSRPPSQALVSLEDALGDTGIANRRARVVQVRPVRRQR